MTMQIQKEVLLLNYFYHLLNNHKIFYLFGLCLQRFMENLCTTYPTGKVFMVRDIKTLNGIFSIFPLMVYLKICH